MGVSIGSASALVVHNENVRVNGEFKVDGGSVTVQRTGAPSAIVVQNDGSANTIKFSDLTTGQEQIFQFRQIAAGDRLDIFDVTNNGVRIAILAPSGNVGIGTVTPAEQLDVNGNIRLTGNIVSPNDICIGNCP